MSGTRREGRRSRRSSSTSRSSTAASAGTRRRATQPGRLSDQQYSSGDVRVVRCPLSWGKSTPPSPPRGVSRPLLSAPDGALPCRHGARESGAQSPLSFLYSRAVERCWFVRGRFNHRSRACDLQSRAGCALDVVTRRDRLPPRAAAAAPRPVETAHRSSVIVQERGRRHDRGVQGSLALRERRRREYGCGTPVANERYLEVIRRFACAEGR